MIVIFTQILIGILTILGLLSESKKNKDKPYSFSNLSVLGYVIIVVVLLIGVFNVRHLINAKKIEKENAISNNKLSEQVLLVNGQFNSMQLRVDSILIENRKLSKILEQHSISSNPQVESKISDSKLENTESNQDVFNEVCDMYKLLYDGEKSLTFLKSQDPAFRPASYLVELIEGGASSKLKSGELLKETVEKLQSNNKEEIGDKAHILSMITCNQSLREIDKEEIIAIFTDILEKDPSGIHRFSCTDGLSNLYPTSKYAFNRLLNSDNKGAILVAAYTLDQISKNQVLEPENLVQLKEINEGTDAGFFAQRAIQNSTRKK